MPVHPTCLCATCDLFLLTFGSTDPGLSGCKNKMPDDSSMCAMHSFVGLHWLIFICVVKATSKACSQSYCSYLCARSAPRICTWTLLACPNIFTYLSGMLGAGPPSPILRNDKRIRTMKDEDHSARCSRKRLHLQSVRSLCMNVSPPPSGNACSLPVMMQVVQTLHENV